MADEFSAQQYKNMSPEDFDAEVKRLGVELNGKTGDDAINMVYYAERRRRGEELAKQEQKRIEAEQRNPAPAPQNVMTTAVEATFDDDDASGDDSDAPDFDSWTNAELRSYAEQRGIDVSKAKSKADLLAAIEAGK